MACVLSNPTISPDEVVEAIEKVPGLVEKIIDFTACKVDELRNMNSENRKWVLGNGVIKTANFFVLNKLVKFVFTPKNINTLGIAAEKVVGKTCKDFKIVRDNYLKKIGIDAHALKKEFLGKNAAISNYDIYKKTDTKELIILRKNGVGEAIHTGQKIK